MNKKNSEYLINRKNNQYEVVIGLEVHAQVLSESKLFSSSATKFGAEPNTQVSLVDAAFPGMLPVINEFCVKQAIKTGIGLNAKINKRSVFDRKNYFYADLPQGYQISQFKDPIVGEGKVVLDMPDGQKNVGIEIDLLSKSEVREKIPSVSKKIIAAAFCHGEGKINPMVATPVLAQESKKIGTKFNLETNN